MNDKLATSQSLTAFLGISRNQLIYWTGRANLIKPFLRLPKTHAYDLKNVLDLILVKTLSSNGANTENIALLFNALNNFKKRDLWDSFKDRRRHFPTNRQVLRVTVNAQGATALLAYSPRRLDSGEKFVSTLAPEPTRGIDVSVSFIIPLNDFVEKAEIFMGYKL